MNFESVSVNDRTQQLILVSKSTTDDKTAEAPEKTSTVFTLDSRTAELRALTTIRFNDFRENLSDADMTVTSGDFHPGSQTLLIGTYGKAFEVSLYDLSSFNEKARTIEIPEMVKAESIAYRDSTQGLSIFTSSEGRNQPLYQILCD